MPRTLSTTATDYFYTCTWITYFSYVVTNTCALCEIKLMHMDQKGISKTNKTGLFATQIVKLVQEFSNYK